MLFATKKIGLTLVLLLFGVGAQAHSPRFSCYVEADQQILCEGGFSDGSSARGVSISMLSYEDKLLWSGKLDAQSQIRFKRPDGRFYRKHPRISSGILGADNL